MRVSRQNFARLLTDTVKVVEGRNTIPILSTVRLVAEAGTLTVSATDLDIEVSGSISAEDGDFAACIDAKLLASIVSRVTGDDLLLEEDGHGATLRSGRSKYKLEVLPTSDFPDMNAGAFEIEFEADLSSFLAPVSFAMSTEQTRFYLNGVYLHEQDGLLVACATDGHRLSTQTTEGVGRFVPAIIPRKTVGLLPEGTLKVELSDSKVRFTAPNVVITSKLIDGTFPDYERVIPKSNDKLIQVDAAELRAAAARVIVVSSDRGRGVRLSVAGGQISLLARGSGEATDVVECNYDGDPVEVGINAQYLSDILAALPDGIIQIAIFDSGSPLLFSSPSNANLRVVGMPMRV